MSVIEARGLACSRGDTRLFRDVSFSAGPGEWIAVRGANGSGKTTLLRCVAGLTRPDTGDVLWDDAPASRHATFNASTVYAGHAAGIKDELSATENLRDALALRCASHCAEEIREALDTVGLAKVRNIATRRLSAGQRRRIGLARLALARAPLWILDEPLTALDAQGEALFTDLLRGHLGAGGVALIATHHDIGMPSARDVRLTP